jgi:hypothetical protein
MNRINQNSNGSSSYSGTHDSSSRMRVQIFTQEPTKFSRISYSLYGGSFPARTPVLHYDAGGTDTPILEIPKPLNLLNTECIESFIKESIFVLVFM